MKYVTLQNVIMKLELYTLTLILVSSGITAIPNDTKGIDNDADTHLSRFIADLWLEGSDIVRIIWRDCSKKLVDVKDVIDHKEYYPKFVRCMKRKTLRALDRCLSPDVVPLADGVNLVRFELVDHSGNVLHDNETSSWTEKELEEGEWRNLALQRMAKVLRTHVIKFDFEEDNVVDKGFLFQIATSPLSYGFYNTYPYDHFERSRNWPPSPVVPRSTNAHNPFTEAGDIQADRTNIAEHVFEENIKNKREIKRNMNVKAVKDEDRQFPVYTEVLNLPHPSIFTVVDAPSPLVDLTTRPGEVQADYALDLPYNGFHFQGSNPVVPA
nr:uncharacterized protein LOC117987020 isoform X2 [Maniola hyperantus]